MNLTHGHTGTNEYRVWCEMKRRCYNKNRNIYRYYGGRGISVCERWRTSFVTFLEDVGNAPSPQHSIDRIDNNGNYEPGNVRWADPVTQRKNRRFPTYTWNGETLTLPQWSERIGVKLVTLQARLQRYGWSIQKTFETPVR